MRKTRKGQLNLYYVHDIRCRPQLQSCILFHCVVSNTSPPCKMFSVCSFCIPYYLSRKFPLLYRPSGILVCFPKKLRLYISQPHSNPKSISSRNNHRIKAPTKPPSRMNHHSIRNRHHKRSRHLPILTENLYPERTHVKSRRALMELVVRHCQCVEPEVA